MAVFFISQFEFTSLVMLNRGLWLYALPSVSVSTFPKWRVGAPIVLVWWFFYSGLLEALLGKPGTLHSPGLIITAALGVPPDLRGAPVLGRLV